MALTLRLRARLRRRRRRRPLNLLLGARSGFPPFWTLLGMKYRENQDFRGKHAIEDAVWKTMVYGPTPDLKLESLHSHGLVWDGEDGKLHGGMKPLCEFRTDLAVVRLLSANVCLRRFKDSDWLQWSSDRSWAKNCSAGRASSSPRRYAS